MPAVRLWNQMGGQIDWSALPLLAELAGVQDVEGLVLDLLTIRQVMTQGDD